MGAEELGPLFVHPSQPGWLWVVAVLAVMPAIGLALLGLIRGRISAAAATAGLVQLPIFAFLLSGLVLMERSKGVEFCSSCHTTMGPIVESVSSGDDSLASIHFTAGTVSHSQGCYACHSGYGIWGGFGAKIAGMEHMLNTLTGRHEFPLELRGAFDIDSCLDCHAENAKFRGEALHRDPDIQAALLAREIGCTGACHAAAHPPEALNGTKLR